MVTVAGTSGPRSERIVTPPFLLLTVVTFFEFLGVGMVIPVLPRFVVDDLHRSTFAVGLAVGIFAVGALACRPRAGRWGDERGRRPLVVAGMVLTAVATAGIGFFPNFWVLLALRVLTGVGQALFFIGAATTAADLAPEERRGEALSLFSLPLYIGLGIGPALGETILHAYGASRAFEAAALAVVLALPIAPLVPDVRADAEPDDGTGRAPRWIHPAGVGPGVVMLLGMVGFIGFQGYLPLYADEIGLGSVQLVFLLYACLVMLTRIVGARYPDRIGLKRTAGYANVLIGVGLLTVAAVPQPVMVYVGVVPLALGMAMQYPALIALALAGPPERERARVISTFSAFFDLAQVLGGLILGAAASGFGNRAVFVGGGISAALAISVLAGVPRRRQLRPAQVLSEPDAWVPPGAD